jgi:hypothetical protein
VDIEFTQPAAPPWEDWGSYQTKGKTISDVDNYPAHCITSEGD